MEHGAVPAALRSGRGTRGGACGEWRGRLLTDRGRAQHGLFVRSGSEEEMELVREYLDNGMQLDPGTCKVSVHSVCNCLLRFLASLSEPVVPFSFYKCAHARAHARTRKPALTSCRAQGRSCCGGQRVQLPPARVALPGRAPQHVLLHRRVRQGALDPRAEQRPAQGGYLCVAWRCSCPPPRATNTVFTTRGAQRSCSRQRCSARRTSPAARTTRARRDASCSSRSSRDAAEDDVVPALARARALRVQQQAQVDEHGCGSVELARPRVRVEKR
jgi:hypothetical protein